MATAGWVDGEPQAALSGVSVEVVLPESRDATHCVSAEGRGDDLPPGLVVGALDGLADPSISYRKFCGSIFAMRIGILVEGVVLFAAVAATVFVWVQPLLLDWLDVANLMGQTAIFPLFCIVAFYYNGLYDLRVVRGLSQFAARLIQGLAVALLLLAGFYTIAPDIRIGNGALFSSVLVIVALLLPIRAVGYFIVRRRAFSDRVLILGTGQLARKLIAEIEDRPHYRYRIVGVADDSLVLDGEALKYPLLGPLEHLGKIVDEVKADRIIVALAERRGRLPMRQLLDAEARGILVEDGMATYEQFTGKLAIEALSPSFLVFSSGFRKTPNQLALRHVVSLVAAAVGLVVTAPLMAVIALAITLDSRGPVFFVQERAGYRGRPFRLVKFRTMRDRTEASNDSVWQRDDEDRITRVGRWLRKLRLDELPQLLNIVKGDMDLVGPRPEIMENVNAMTEMIPYYALRHVVRPGLTGWAQVRYGYSVSLEQVTEKMRHDLFYIKHMSFRLDLRILADTAKIALFGRRAQ
jgi:sugar transferase (PEP-CTERM system associated)